MGWTLRVEFATREEQAARQIEGDWEERAFVRHLWANWGGLPEENREDIVRQGQTVTATCDVLDALLAAVQWLGYHTIPRQVLLERTHDYR
jgi:hypothetical protein